MPLTEAEHDLYLSLRKRANAEATEWMWPHQGHHYNCPRLFEPGPCGECDHKGEPT